MVAHWLYDDFMLERSRRPRVVFAWWCAMVTHIALRSTSMFTASCFVMAFFLTLGMLQVAYPGEATLLQYGALGAMCIFLMGLLVWMLRVGVKLIDRMQDVLQKNTEALTKVHEVMSNCLTNQNGDFR